MAWLAHRKVVSLAKQVAELPYVFDLQDRSGILQVVIHLNLLRAKHFSHIAQAYSNCCRLFGPTVRALCCH
jgi:hypothetical protein